jgi:transcriptional regulator with XRE-family HTH domain
MMTPEQIEQALSDRNLREVARRTGLHYNTIRRYAQGVVERPEYEAVRTLSEYLSTRQREEATP